MPAKSTKPAQPKVAKNKKDDDDIVEDDPSPKRFQAMKKRCSCNFIFCNNDTPACSEELTEEQLQKLLLLRQRRAALRAQLQESRRCVSLPNFAPIFFHTLPRK